MFDTFSGFVWDAIGRVPAEGEKFSLEVNDLKIDVKILRIIWWTMQSCEKLRKEEVMKRIFDLLKSKVQAGLSHWVLAQ